LLSTIACPFVPFLLAFVLSVFLRLTTPGYFFGFLRPSGPGGSSDKVYQLLAHGRWFSPGTPASSTTKTGRHDIAEALLKVALSTTNQILRFYSQTRNILDTICVTI